MKRKAVITGMGCINSLGEHPDEIWDALHHKKIGITRMDAYEQEPYSCSFGGVVQQFSAKMLDISGKNMMNRANQLELYAVIQACTQYGALDVEEQIDCAVYLGNQLIHIDYETMTILVNHCLEDGCLDFTRLGEHIRKIPPLSGVKLLPTVPSHFIAKTYHAHGEGNLLYNGEISGLLNVIQAAQDIEMGTADRIIVASVFSPFQPHEYLWLCDEQMVRTTTIDDDSSQLMFPFDERHQGIIYGEGAAALIIESEETARAKNRTILGYVEGGSINMFPGETFYSLTAEGFKKNLYHTLEKSEQSIKDIDLIYAHGCSSREWDNAELEAIYSIWEHSDIQIRSSKGNIGYTGCASGIMDCVLAIQSMRHNAVFDTINYQRSELDQDVSAYFNGELSTVERCLINNAGLGGSYCSVVLAKGDSYGK
ncbi:beta-ketoacyl-[acyl-carrier-protein] synthase family protein [Paenibacillus sp. 1001270B_150601_E10]|uniref:beta-ketoacyl-[acyl-carrier-protein] synthase family protein n=1 Tax=Paenibacillus sp. 1001270B_150601_E10 TaxID=2787079 RepID=UPI00189F3DBF|nr:beta-ketoacyl synthase [Paenibacillus sp. 1001270B_150601_E10]